MNIARTIFVASLATASLWGQPRPDPPVTTSIDNVELVAAGTDHVRFEVHAKVVATRSVTVARIRFEEMRLGEIPFYLSPIDQRMELKSGQAALLPAIAMTVYFRDLDSLQPLEEVVRNGEIRVRGRASADLDLSLIEKLALHKWSGHADIPIDNAIAVTLPGGLAGRTAAMFALNAAQTAIGVAGSTLNGLRNSQRTWNGELKTDFTESLLAAEASYKLLTSEGQTIEMSTRGLGFRVSDGRVLLTGEMAEPWKYDADTLALLQSRKATIVGESRNIAVWPLDANMESAASLANGRLQIEKLAMSEAAVIIPEGDKIAVVHLAKRDIGSNYALVRFTGDADKQEAIPVARLDQNWDRVAVFKLNSDGKAETIFVPARRQGDRLMFDTPVDDETFGSPIVVPGGAIGMVQDEHSGMILPARL